MNEIRVLRLVPRWKFLLPLLQLIVAISLWLYMPVQFRKDLLRLQGKPTEHPYRYRLQFHEPPVLEREYLFPPVCGRVLYAVNLPADVVRVADQARNWHQWRWDFTLPVGDSAAIEPRQIAYILLESDVFFFGAVILLWYWVGSRIDESMGRRRGVNVPRRRLTRIAELVVVTIAAVLLTAYCARLINESPILTTAQGRITPAIRRIGEFGLLWPAALLGYAALGVRGELKKRVLPVSPAPEWDSPQGYS